VLTAAFEDPDPARIAEGVRQEGAVLAELVEAVDGRVDGYVLFSRMTVAPQRFFAGLGPVAVRPELQRQGVGQDLCRAGLERMRELGVEAIVVLGHPTYYPKFGFSAEAAKQLKSPFAGREAFMALALKPGALEEPLEVAYPAAFG
jgi:putative acetyltransferase